MVVFGIETLFSIIMIHHDDDDKEKDVADVPEAPVEEVLDETAEDEDDPLIGPVVEETDDKAWE